MFQKHLKQINFIKDEEFAQTQDIEPLITFSYSIMMWRSEVFKKEFEKKGFALFCGNFGVKNIGRLASIIVKTEKDLMVVDSLLRGSETQQELSYDPLVKDFL